MKVAVIGGGSMGLAFAKRWLDQSIVKAENLFIVETSLERRKIIEKEIGIVPMSDFACLEQAQIVFIAVKPQDFAVLAKSLSAAIQQEKLIVSIMAGVPIEKISSSISQHKRIVRAMPNLPIVVGSGITVYVATTEVEPIALGVVEQLLSACGTAMYIQDENLLNAVTATSGSGPGYIYYALESVMQQCKQFGFSDEQAKNIIASTFEGAIKLWREDNRSAQELRSLVTSKGGTTEAAISYFEKNNLGKIIKEGLLAAAMRAKELST